MQIKLTLRKTKLKIMMEIVKESLKIINSSKGEINDFGKLLNEAWKIKKSLSNKITNPYIDEIYESAMNTGALGGKLLGAGSGGFMLFFA